MPVLGRINCPSPKPIAQLPDSFPRPSTAAISIEPPVSLPRIAQITAELALPGASYLGAIKINFPDAGITSLNSVAEGDWVVMRCNYSGRHRASARLPVDGGMLVGVRLPACGSFVSNVRPQRRPRCFPSSRISRHSRVYATFLGRSNVHSLWTAAGISCTDVLPKPNTNPCCVVFPT